MPVPIIRNNMIITEQKPLEEIIDSLKKYSKIFLIGCGECATVCKSGGKDEVAKIQRELESVGKKIVGISVPDAPCLASSLKMELARNTASLKEADAVLVLACGLGVQSVKDNNRFKTAVFAACNTLCGAVVDSQGKFLEKCSMCAECVLNYTGGICPVTLCPKGILNGPCGGMEKEKCEVDRDKDCAWVLIYKELDKNNDLDLLKKLKPPRNYKNQVKPRVFHKK